MFTPKKYKIRSGTIDSGKSYEIRTATLLSLTQCCRKDLEHFWIASNVDECGALDDIILFVKQINERGLSYLLQLKHQDNPRNISRDQILAAKGDFSLETYLKSCLNLSSQISGQSPKKSDVIQHLTNNPDMIYMVFTNKKVAGEFEFLEKKGPHSHFEDTTGDVYGFKIENLRNIFTTPNDPREAFIKKVFLYTNQHHIKEIDKEIKNILQKLIGSINKSDKDLDEILRSFVFFMEEWAKGRLNGHYPLEKVKILKKIAEILLKPFMVALNEHIQIQGDEERYDLWNEMIKDKDVIVINANDKDADDFIQRAIYKAMLDYENDVKNCTTIKKDMLRDSGSNQITTFRELYEYLWKTNKIPLVIQVASKDEIEKVLEILKISEEAFRIMILNKSEVSINDLGASTEKLLTVSDLKQEHRKKLFEIPIRLQGRVLSGFEELNLDVKEILDLEVRDVINILRDNFNISQEFEALPDVFVDISLKRTWLRSEVLQEVADDIFVVLSKDIKDFKDFIQLNHDIDDTEIIDCKAIKNVNYHKIILYDKLDDVNEIENSLKKIRGNRSIHFMNSHEDLKLEWIKSWGTVKNLRNFRISEKFEEKRVMASEAIKGFRTEMKSIIISSNPGMGKSVFINYFAHNVPTNYWVVKIMLAKYKTAYKNFLNESECDINLKRFFEEILKEECKENFLLAKAIFEEFYKTNKIIVLLDGFDEIPIKYQNDAKQLIKFLSKSSYFVLTTTRPVLKNDLEILLDTLSLSLNMFTREDQEYYLKNYFLRFTEVVCELDIVNLFVESLLNAAMKNLNDHDNEFTGVPLQTLLLAEVFIEDFKIFVETRKFVNKHFDLLYLYRNFIEKKIRIACEKFGDISESMIHQYRVCRTFYALRVLFLEDDLKELKIDLILKEGKTVFPDMLELVQKDGIVVAETETSIRFIHQTFAEYLAAEWLIESMNNGNKPIAKNLLRSTFDPNLKVVRNIFDRILAKDCPLHLAIINFQIDKIAALLAKHSDDLDKYKRNFLHLLASWGVHHPTEYITTELFQLEKESSEDDMFEIFKLIPDEKLKISKDQIFEYSPIDYAVISSSLHIANALCERIKSLRISAEIKEHHISVFLVICYKMNYLALSRIIINYTSIDSQLTIDKKNFKIPLHTAVRSETEEIVKKLINESININKTDCSGKTALHWSVIQGNLNITRLLVSKGIDLNFTDNYKRTALHYAVIACPQHQLDIISELSDTDFSLTDENNMTPFLWAAHYGYTKYIDKLIELDVNLDQANVEEMTALHYAAGNGHVDTVEHLLLKGASVDSRSQQENTPLTFSARCGHTDVISILLKNGADLEAQDYTGMSALVWAAHSGHKDLVTLLFSKQAQVEPKRGVNALVEAARYGHKDIVVFFISNGVDIESMDMDKKTSLHWAACHGYKDIIKFLLSIGANVNAKDRTGYNVLYGAIQNDFVHVAKLLLSRECEIPKNALLLAAECGSTGVINLFLSEYENMDVNLKDKKGMAPLHLAARSGSKESVAALLIAEAHIEIKNNKNETPLIIAVKNVHEEVINLLLKEGANIDAKTDEGETPLIIAVKHYMLRLTKLLVLKGAVIATKDIEGKTAFHWAVCAPCALRETADLLLSKSPELIEMKTDKEETPLILAAQNGSTEVFEFLLSKNADIEARDCQGMNSLHWASSKGRVEIVYLLIKQNANLEAKDNNGKTALMLAAEKGDVYLIELLLSFEAKLRATDKDGQTALDWATKCNQKDAIEVLKPADGTFNLQPKSYLLISIGIFIPVLSWLLLKRK